MIPADSIFPKNLTAAEAVKIQNRLRGEVKIIPLAETLKKPLKFIGGCDMSMNMFAVEGFAGFVTLDYENLNVVGHSVIKSSIGFPYIPGLLSFREIPMLAKAWDRLKQKPDVLVVDGTGIAHPRRLGIASHLGLVLNIPTIGCAKSLLTGIYDEPEGQAGSISYIYDRFDKTTIIGAAVRTKRNVKPVFISPGHLITLEESIEIVLKCVLKHRLPEPARRAHNTMNEYRIDNKLSVV